MMNLRTAWQIDAALGEGPVWIAQDRALWFVDIKRGLLHRYDPASDSGTTIDAGQSPSFIAALADGGMLVGDRARLMRFVDGACRETLATIDMPAHNRTNDATVDPAGRLWFGTMDDEAMRSTGGIYRFDHRGITPFGCTCTITNGPAASPDGRLLYTVDTLAGEIRRHAIDGDGAIDAGEVLIRIAPEHGKPDGVTTDSEGAIWVGLWGGWCVRRYSGDGVVMDELALPCAQVTKVAFGGPDLRTGFITTARVDLSERELADQPLAGSLFAFDAPVAGRPVPPVRLA